MNSWERTVYILHQYLWIFPVYVEMDNISTKPSSWYYGSVNGLLDHQTFNMNHVYIHPDMLWFYSQEYIVATSKLTKIWSNLYPKCIKSVIILHCTWNQYQKLINTSNLTSPSPDWLSLQLFHELDVYT